MRKEKGADKDLKPKTKYIFIDIDHTLLSHKKGVLKSSLKAIDLARKNGHKVFISSGRVGSAVDECLKFYPFDGFLFGCGAYIEVDGEVIYENILPQEEVARVHKALEEADTGYVLEGKEYSYWNQKAIDSFLMPQKKAYHDVPQKVMAHIVVEDKMFSPEAYKKSPSPIHKFSVFMPDRESLYACPIEQLVGEAYEVIRYVVGAEIIPHGVDKATGMLKVLEHYGASLEDSFAFGDSMNDYSMVKQAGVGVAMGNAAETLKEVADYVTLSCDEDGIYQAFEHFGLMDKT